MIQMPQPTKRTNKKTYKEFQDTDRMMLGFGDDAPTIWPQHVAPDWRVWNGPERIWGDRCHGHVHIENHWTSKNWNPCGSPLIARTEMLYGGILKPGKL